MSSADEAIEPKILFQSLDAAYVETVRAQGRWVNNQGATFRVTTVTKGQGDPLRPDLNQWVVRGVLDCGGDEA